MSILRTPVPWAVVFGDERPVEVEIGPGRGELLLADAARAAATNFFAIERTVAAADALLARALRLGLRNVRAVGGDARCVLAACVPDASVAAYRIYFPDPWPKRRHRRRRLVTAAFAAELARTLAPGGAVHAASDLPRLVAEIARHLAAAGLRPVAGATRPSAQPPTTYERRYARAGTHYVRFARPG